MRTLSARYTAKPNNLGLAYSMRIFAYPAKQNLLVTNVKLLMKVDAVHCSRSYAYGYIVGFFGVLSLPNVMAHRAITLGNPGMGVALNLLYCFQ